jgi:hypothetical protein
MNQQSASNDSDRVGGVRRNTTSGERPSPNASAVTSGTIGGGSKKSTGTVTNTIGVVWPLSVTNRVRDATANITTTSTKFHHDTLVCQGRNTAADTPATTKPPPRTAKTRRSAGPSGVLSRPRVSEMSSSWRGRGRARVTDSVSREIPTSPRSNEAGSSLSVSAKYLPVCDKLGRARGRARHAEPSIRMCIGTHRRPYNGAGRVLRLTRGRTDQQTAD